VATSVSCSWNGGTSGCIGQGLPCEADLDCNGTVDGGDLGLLLLAWGSCPPGCDAVPMPPECEEQGLMGGGGSPDQLQGSAPLPSDDDTFYQWALGATIEELFQWLESVLLEDSE